MGQLDTAAFDPIFFMHHSFVDYLWELFRTNLRSLGADPEIYPDIEDAESRHHSTASTGFGDLTQADGYLDSLTDSYEYESAPICTARFPDCGSRSVFMNSFFYLEVYIGQKFCRSYMNIH
ncbi:tyrosinase [Plakobranchus ocellatus]|uniref:Tyrosinase n=1 Tax=Plakobranchus ocellatus TaxID=259542 RepID=A0AAV3Y3A3_9GAST|nr:tyrosinase [Plakobranchus ocellatus]